MAEKLTKGTGGEVLSVRVSQEVIDKLDSIAVKAGLSRSNLVANILEVVTGGLASVDKVGLLKAIVLLRDFEYEIRTWCDRWQNDEFPDKQELIEEMECCQEHNEELKLKYGF